MLRPSAFCDLASRPRSRSSRPSGGAMASISGLGPAAGAGVDRWRRSGSGPVREVDVGDRAPRRVAGNGRVVADGGQPAGVDPIFVGSVPWLKVMPDDAV